MTSERQIQANRQNSRKSTGPKTVGGKKRSAENARKHNLLGKEIVVASGPAQEDPNEYDELLERFMDDYQPRGLDDMIQIETMANAYWRRRRVIQAETNAVIKRQEQLAEDVKHEYRRSAREASDVLVNGVPAGISFSTSRRTPTDEEVARYQDTKRSNLRHNPMAIPHLLDTLDAAISGVEQTGIPSHAILDRLRREFVRDGVSIPERILAIVDPHAHDGQATESDERLDDESDEEDDKEMINGSEEDLEAKRQAIVALLREERAELEQLQVEANQRLEAELERAKAEGALLPDDDLQRFHRYEVMYERQYYAARDRLERVRK